MERIRHGSVKALAGEAKIEGTVSMKPIRVLQVLGSLNLGGAESRVMDLYRNINREEIQFDFLIHSKEKQYFEEEVEALGGNIYRLPRFKVYNYFAYRRAVKKFFESHPQIRAVHGHMTSTAGIYLPIAKKCGVPMTIAHARSAGVDPGIKGKITRLLRKNLAKKADYCFTCSALAGEAVFGKKAWEEGRVQTIPNAIDASKYTFDPKVRAEVRKELKAEDTFVIAHIGRFDFMKNHRFLVEIFEEIVREKKDSMLLLMGDGEGKEEIQKLCQKKGLQEKVIFLGNCKNVSRYLQAADYFVFPSLFEGLPGTVVEAQASGLKCLISDTITKEVALSELVTCFSLEKTAGEWAAYILKTREYVRKDQFQTVSDAGFDIKKQVESMTAFYKTAEKKKLMLMVPMLHQGGFERVCVLSARMLQPYYQVFICVFNLDHIFYDVSGIPVIHLNLGVKNGKLGKVSNVIKRSLQTAVWKKRLGIDVTYSFGPTANLVNVLSKSRGEAWCGIRSYMDLDPSNDRMLAFFVKNADKVICCSKVIEEELGQRFDCKKAVTLYNPYNRDWILQQAQEEILDLPWSMEDTFTIVSMGREDDVKGFWHLIKAFFLVTKKIPQARLLIVGDGTFTEYKKLAENLKISEKVWFTGKKSNPFPYLKAAQISVLTSYYEGFPNALVEAMTLGLPVIATDCLTGPAEILEKRKDSREEISAEYGILIPNMSQEKNLDAHIIDAQEEYLAQRMMELYENEALYREYGKKAQERSAIFSYEHYMEQFKQLMQE